MGPVFILLFTTSLAAQKFDSALSIFRKKFPAEKVYIHYNKEYYTAGETIWFKAYLTINHAPSGLSNNFYLQLRNDKGIVVSNKKYPVKGTAISGNIDIPDSIDGGVYTVNAFTAAMLNPDADFISTKNLHIYNSSSGQANNVLHDPAAPKISLLFFPEGGSLIADINTVIAFKAVTEFGYPLDVKGMIKTEDGAMVLPFSSYHDGIGQFLLTPQANKKYVAVTEVKGQVYTFSLPPVQSNGLALKVEDENGGKLFIVSGNQEQKPQVHVIKVVAQINNVVVYENEFYSGDHFSVKGHIPTDSLPSGILQVIVLNQDDAPLLERLTFINNREYEAGASLSVLKQGTNAREMNYLQFDFPDTAQRSCSVAITDYQDDTTPSKENIISSLLLTSDLKGDIFNPGYYFSSKNDSVKTAMDNLMLTHGWRRFTWKKILHNEYPEPIKEDEYLINISGTVKNPNKTEVMSGGLLNIFIITEDSALFTYNYPVNKEGHFLLDSLLFAGSSRFYYSYTNAKGKQKPVTVILGEKKSHEWPAGSASMNKDVSSWSETPVKKETSDVRKVVLTQKGLENVKELENVTVLSKPERPIDILNEKYATGIFKTGSRYIIDNITKPEVLTGGGPGAVRDYIASLIPRVKVKKGYFVNIRLHDMPVAVFIDQFPATMFQLDQLRIEQIGIVKFWDNDPVVVSSDRGGGTIVVYTKKYEDVRSYNITAPEAPYFLYNGYSIEKEFYSPDYSIPSDKHKDPDVRTTLCWNPKVYTNANENCIQVNFFNNDWSRKFKIVLEGIDNKGRLIFFEKIIGEGL